MVHSASFLALVAFISDGASAVLVLDDNVATRSHLKPSTLESCLKDAHNGNFHQGSTVEGVAVYTFDPEQDGCYVIEEWHPGNDQNCAKHMSTAVRLDVDYCKGKSAYTFIDQALNGGRWNVLGALPFYKGWQGKFTMKNEGGMTNCKTGNMCLFAVDAFRIRQVPYGSGGQCRVPEEVYAPEQPEDIDEDSNEADTTTLRPTTQLTTTPSLTSKPPATSVEASLASQAQSTIEDMVQIVVDDINAVSHAAWHWHEMNSKSQHLSCGKQGWNQRFLFLDPQLTEETEAPATFTFDPPSDGCYLVEEFHPANVCDKQLSPLVQVKIEYCRKKETHATLDQSKFGNQWNSVALLPFNKGYPGKVTVHHPQVNEGIAVADAFRFTRVSSSCAAAPHKLVEYARLSQHPVSVTMDDRHAFKMGGSVSSVCGKTALDATAHVSTDSHASAMFTFVPPSTGCFRVDEFHPRSDETCSLAAKAGVQVDYCFGMSWQGSFPLSSGGGQWNVVGHFPFYAGVPGNITSRRLGEGKWVADGFRLTKVSEKCSRRPYAALVTLRTVGVDLEASALPDGQLTTHADLRIAFHEAVVASSKLSSQNVRLIGLRRGSIIAEFELLGSRSRISQAISHLEADLANTASSPLGNAMCAAASAGRGSPVQCHTELVRTEFLDGVEPDEYMGGSVPGESQQGTLAIILFVAACVCVVGMIGAILCIMRSNRNIGVPKQKPMESVVRAVVTNQKGGKDDAIVANSQDYEKGEKDNASDCDSTATPASPKVSCEVQTDISGDISETTSQASRECTLEVSGIAYELPRDIEIGVNRNKLDL
jgi:hypothetical protein